MQERRGALEDNRIGQLDVARIAAGNDARGAGDGRRRTDQRT